MKMKLVFTVMMVMVLLLAACSNNEAPETNGAQSNEANENAAPVKESASEEEEVSESQSPLEAAVQSVVVDRKEVSISFWTGTGAANFPVLEKMVADFQTVYPHIKVEFSNQGPIGELTVKLTQNIVAKSTPTLSNIDAITFPEYISSQAIVDLLPYYEDGTIGLSGQEGAIFPHYIEEVKSLGPEGTMYGFPTNKKTADVLVYNKTYFDSKGWAAPKTWDEVVSYSMTIHEETGMPGFSFDNAYGDAPFKLLSQQWGSPYIQADGSIDINNEAGREALKFYKDNMTQGYFTMPALMPSAGGKYSSNGFVMEETYMFVGAAAGIQFSLPKPDSGHKDFEVGVAPVPQKESSDPVYFTKGENYVVFSNATEEERVAAWLLISFMSDAKHNVEWLTSTGNMPLGQSMLEEPAYKAFLEAAPSAAPEYYKAAAVNAVLSVGELSYNPVISQSGKLADEVGKLWEAVMIGGGDADQLLQETADMLK